jgi:predicted nucleic acid-binding protein
MNRVFVDTWAWYALADTRDRDHRPAQLANDQLLDQGYTFVTTNFVLDESITLIRYHIHHAAAVHFWHTLQQLADTGLVEIVRVSESHEVAAWAIFEQYDDQALSYTDCTSFAVMKDLGLTHVFSADHHFAILGFVPVS